MSTTFSILFLVAALVHVVVEFWLSSRQVSHVRRHRETVPAAFAAVVTPSEYGKAADYAIARQGLARAELLFDTAVLLWLTLGGGLAAIARRVAALDLGTLSSGVALVLATLLVMSALSIPMAAYRTFVFEESYGFNRTTPGVFISDLVKGWLLGGFLGGALAALILWVMAKAGATWWLIAWLVWVAASLLILWGWPRLIAPLFNKFTPLADGSLRARIDALLQRCGFQTEGVFVMDGSRRSSHGNAYFTGLGRAKRIVFFDTLLESLTPAQVESVLAHELAHFRLKHVPQRLLLSAAMSLIGFALLGWLARQSWFYLGLGITTASDATALLLFMIALPSFTWLLSPALAAWSRKHEFEADDFATQHADGRELAGALVQLYRDNASALSTDPLYSAFHDSHPPPAVRVARLLGSASTVPAALPAATS